VLSWPGEPADLLRLSSPDEEWSALASTCQSCDSVRLEATHIAQNVPGQNSADSILVAEMAVYEIVAGDPW
jgi:hypothetical protein